jgi:hypothetical protein
MSEWVDEYCRTPFDVLLSLMGKGLIEHEGGLVEQSLIRLVGIREGKEASRVPKRYTGHRGLLKEGWELDMMRRGNWMRNHDCDVKYAEMKAENDLGR